MKKLLLLPLMCAASLAFAAPNTAIKALGQDLKSFSPASITAHQGAEKKETVVIVLPQARITDTIYTAVIKGACMRLWLEPKDKYLNSVAQIAVLNQWAKRFLGGSYGQLQAERKFPTSRCKRLWKT